MNNDSPICNVCSGKASPFLEGREDHEYGVEHQFPYFRCRSCKHVFAVVPQEFDLSILYNSYSTHIPEEEKRTRNSINEDWLSVVNGRNSDSVKVLDFGCGNGQFLIRLKERGYKDLYAYDFDPVAMKLARKYGANEADIYSDSIKYDLIFLNHVIEHLNNPEEILTRLILLIKDGGTIYIKTPNSTSFLSRIFGEYWRGWETPRHLNIYNVNSAKIFCEKLTYDHDEINFSSYSINEMYEGLYHESFPKKYFNNKLGKLTRWSLYFLFKPISWVTNLFSNSLGEEIVIVINKR
ncbi:class I SAM-dependent methyltransferase [Vibrio caribbeanicus]|uniref:class I SAM-dependent methyltransferase n=1 Tax=Vibrio caribbeanicus TaxID=701175 RepID=UPI002284E81D|nr:class I SAM-dependent methyltransferase [Vibrio caribbeanicus]MCY9844242.1 class I SAM-dependent methyltransferase [Vibrio caribbeanicus]